MADKDSDFVLVCKYNKSIHFIYFSVFSLDERNSAILLFAMLKLSSSISMPMNFLFSLSAAIAVVAPPRNWHRGPSLAMYIDRHLTIKI